MEKKAEVLRRDSVSRFFEHERVVFEVVGVLLVVGDRTTEDFLGGVSPKLFVSSM